MRGAIVITTINSPTRAVEELATIEGWELIVVGDNKTPADWQHEGAEFLSIDAQRSSSWRLASLLPENHYCRKNLGYLQAMSKGYGLIAETDDDNRPHEWDLNSVAREVRGRGVTHSGWLNVYPFFTDEVIWPRGLPLDEIFSTPKELVSAPLVMAACSVQQFLAAGDPDVDAIYRLTNGKDDHRFEGEPIVLSAGTMTTFNSQSTIWYSEAFALMYLPSFVSFRMTDIWRSIVAQVCMWASGQQLAYSAQGVWQDRNPHNLMRDFRDEVVGYENNDDIARGLQELTLTGTPATDLRTCYEYLQTIGIVESRELDLVDAWLEDIASIVAVNGRT